ncbi:MAG: zf-TFIIB domain-containing protein [Candidatus Binataceae bacterium]
MQDEKDRLGDKLREVEKAREDQWAHEEDSKLLAKMRQHMSEKKQAGAALKCPHCGKALVAKARKGFAMMACPDEEGAWLDSAVLEALPKARK